MVMMISLIDGGRDRLMGGRRCRTPGDDGDEDGEDCEDDKR